MGHGPDQQRLDFNLIKPTSEECARIKRIVDEWTREEAEDFTCLPGEPLEEYLRERDIYVSNAVAFGPTMPKEPSEAWKMIHGQSCPPPPPPRQLKLPLKTPKPNP